MGHRPKHKTENYKTSKRKQEEMFVKSQKAKILDKIQIMKP